MSPRKSLIRSERNAFVQLRMDLGEQLRNRREELRLTQTEVAVAAGLSQGYISQIEKGEAPSSPDRIESWVKICDALQLDALTCLKRVWESRAFLQFAFSEFAEDEREHILRVALRKQPEPLVPRSERLLAPTLTDTRSRR